MKPLNFTLNLGLTIAMVDDIAKKVLVERPDVFKIIRKLDKTGLMNIFEIAEITDTTIEEVYSVTNTEVC